MKKLYTKPEIKAFHKRKVLKSQRIHRKKRILNERAKGKRHPRENSARKQQHIDSKLTLLIAPSDLRLIQNTNECLEFFRDLRSEEYRIKKNEIKFVNLSLKKVTQIDYGTISILTAIGDDLKFKGVILRTYLPDNLECKEFMIDSGYLNNLFDNKGRPFPKAPKSAFMFFEKGCEKLSDEDSKKISVLIKNVVRHLAGVEKYCQPLRTIILEVCGNSIEWSGTENKQWLLGAKFLNDRVIFTVTDVGKGILDTLHRRFDKKFFDTLSLKSKVAILKGAFDKKYSSTSKEDNRNKGLPAVKANFNLGTISELKVLTNNVILHFDNDSLSKEFKKGSPWFKGTYYQWEMTRDCLTKLI